jgi:hypothetical protein
MSNVSCENTNNINFLNDTSFKFKILNSPNVTFFVTKVAVPEISVETTTQSTLYNAIPMPGDEIQYTDLVVSFKLQENLADYLEIYNWLINSGHPTNLTDLYEQQNYVRNNPSKGGEASNGGIFSDAVLTVLDNSLNPKFDVYFYKIFPVRLSSINFSTQNRQSSPLEVTASFKYVYFDVKPHVI